MKIEVQVVDVFGEVLDRIASAKKVAVQDLVCHWFSVGVKSKLSDSLWVHFGMEEGYLPQVKSDFMVGDKIDIIFVRMLVNEFLKSSTVGQYGIGRQDVNGPQQGACQQGGCSFINFQRMFQGNGGIAEDENNDHKNKHGCYNLGLKRAKIEKKQTGKPAQSRSVVVSLIFFSASFFLFFFEPLNTFRYLLPSSPKLLKSSRYTNPTPCV